jgi:hypothetical protein
MDSQLKAMHDKFVTQGYPVIIGEYCACNKTDAITQQGIIDAIMSGIGSNITPTPTTPAPTPTSTSTPTPTVTATPTPTASQNPTGCSVSYSQNDWGSGATVSITIKNNGAAAINGWTLAWNFTGNQTTPISGTQPTPKTARPSPPKMSPITALSRPMGPSRSDLISLIAASMPSRPVLP